MSNYLMSFLIAFITLISTSNFVAAEPPAPAVIEIGSGLISVYFAGKDKILEPILYQSVSVPFAKDLMNHKRITAATENLARETLNRFKDEVTAKGANFITTVATEAFRKAPNGNEVRQRLEQDTGLAIVVLTPHEEASLGFLTASQVTNIPIEQLTVFDMGSGSVQLAKQNNNQELDAISKPMGTALAMELFKKIRPNCTSKDIFPVTPEELVQFSDMLEMHVRDNFADVIWQNDQDKQVAGIGFVQLLAIGMRDLGFGIPDEKTNTVTFTIDEVHQTLALITSSDEGVREEAIKQLTKTSQLWKHPATLSITLAYTLMKQAGFEKITCSLNKDLIGNAIGILSIYFQVL